MQNGEVVNDECHLVIPQARIYCHHKNEAGCDDIGSKPTVYYAASFFTRNPTMVLIGAIEFM
jgi:hypothetical protein